MINSFRGNNRFLSNFWFARFEFDFLTWPTVEHAYQAAKTMNPIQQAMIRAADTPGSAKRYGAKVELNPDWHNIKVPLMMKLVDAKFRQNPELKAKLLATGTQRITEGNMWHDKFWGCCNCARCGGIGHNKMGLILMHVRSNLQ